MVSLEKKPVKKRTRGINKKIGFTEEIVTKNLVSHKINESNTSSFMDKIAEEIANDNCAHQLKKPKKQKGSKEIDAGKDAENVELKKRKRNEESETTENSEKTEESGIKKSDDTVSKRALKRMKYQELLDKKKNESETTLRSKALNYLSKWKYNKTDWKFEKLRQVWLVQNLYDSSKIEDKFWETIVEYFNSAQGKVREKILKEAIKIVETEDIELNDQVKFQRAKDIVQSLQ